VSVRPQIEALERLEQDFNQVEAVGSLLRVFVEGQAGIAAAGRIADLLSGLEVGEMRTSQPELEDAFIALLHRRKLVKRASRQDLMASDATKIEVNDGIAIQARGLSRDFGDFRAVDQVSFQVSQGEIFGLLGANGAGKTTVIKMLTGILPPTAGEGKVAGEDMRRAVQSIKQHIGYMSQAFSLYQDLTVLENIRLYARIYAVPRRQIQQRIDWVVRMAGLEGVEDRLAGKLPMGIRQRLALGCALVHQPRVLFLDEPTSGVDPIGRRRFWEILVHLARVDKVAILVTTHYMSEAEHCDRLALMHAGQIIADDSPESMKQSLQQQAGQLLEIATDQPLIAMELLEQSGFEGVALFGKRIHFLAREPQQAKEQVRRLLAGHGVRLLSALPRAPGMEDVFVYRILARERLELSP